MTSPIGVLLIIFEARPDALPQIASLAIRSGNGLLLKVRHRLAGQWLLAGLVVAQTLGQLCVVVTADVAWIPLYCFRPRPTSPHPAAAAQGGKEATRSNALLHKLIVDAVAEVAPSVGRDLIGLVTSRDEIDELLKLHDVIDLVIPRGSNQLVRAAGQGCMHPACAGIQCDAWQHVRRQPLLPG